MLSKTKYATLCVLGIEIFYVLCLGYGLLLSDKGKELHRALFELLPGFAWGDPLGIARGALFLGIGALVWGWYIAWMHNASLIVTDRGENEHRQTRAAR